jgi:nucleoid-associated protein YgaU
MPLSVTSRYHRLDVLVDPDRGPYVAQRPLPAPAVAAGGVTHVLVGEETLDQLAKQYYGREELWWRIADANPARHPADWRAGDTLVIPPLTAAPAPTE